MAVIDLAAEPPLPLGRRVELPDRGTTFVRTIAGPAGAPTVVLLHGWIASGGLNWFNAFEPLSAHYNVIAPDLRGHGRGIRTRRRFRLADCADDVAALLDELDSGPVIAVGYSMGGPVAQLLWHRHPRLVEGLEFCATADRFLIGARERMVFNTVMAAAVGTTKTGAWVGRWPVVRRWATPGTAARPTNLRTWAAGEMRRHDLVKLMEAGEAIGSYTARSWIRFIDVPTAVVVTDRDRAIRPDEQMHMASLIPGATLHHIDDGHAVCAKREFGPVLVDAVHSVADRLPADRLSARRRSRGAQ
jgi:pimeloyl-ACP methyl ester carboxylesterase